MEIFPIKNDRDLLDRYVTSVRENPPLAVSLHGLGEGDGADGIATRVQEFATAELLRAKFQRLHESGYVKDDAIPHVGRPSLEDLPFTDEQKDGLEEKIHNLIRGMTSEEPALNGGRDPGDERPTHPGGGTRPVGGTGSIDQSLGQGACVCVASSIPGSNLSLSGFTPTLGTAIGVIVGSHDALKLELSDGASKGLGSSDMLVGLATTVSWAKQIMAWNCRRGRIAAVFQERTNNVPSFMSLTKDCNGTDTIVFSKPAFLGVWIDLAHFDITLFWNLFGGKVLKFTWTVD